MSLIKILLLLRSLPITELLRLPKNYKDSEEVGDYLTHVVEALCVLAEKTGTTIDDKALGAIEAVLNDDEAWKAIHGVFVVLFLAKDKEFPIVACPPAVVRVAADVGFNPLIILSIVQAVIAFLRLFGKGRSE